MKKRLQRPLPVTGKLRFAHATRSRCPFRLLCGEESTSERVAVAVRKAPQAEMIEAVPESVVVKTRQLEVSHRAP